MEISILASMLEAFFSSLVGSVTTTVLPLLDEELLAGVVGGGEETLVAGDGVVETLAVRDGDGVVADDTLEDTLAAAAEMEADKTEEEATVKGELLLEERLAGAGGLAEVDPFTGGGLVEEFVGGPVVMFRGGPPGGLAGGLADVLAGGLPGGPAGELAGGPAGGLAGGFTGGLAGGLPSGPTGGLAGGLTGGLAGGLAG
jgi:hypothetical protein